MDKNYIYLNKLFHSANYDALARLLNSYPIHGDYKLGEAHIAINMASHSYAFTSVHHIELGIFLHKLGLRGKDVD